MIAGCSSTPCDPYSSDYWLPGCMTTHYWLATGLFLHILWPPPDRDPGSLLYLALAWSPVFDSTCLQTSLLLLLLTCVSPWHSFWPHLLFQLSNCVWPWLQLPDYISLPTPSEPDCSTYQTGPPNLAFPWHQRMDCLPLLIVRCAPTYICRHPCRPSLLIITGCRPGSLHPCYPEPHTPVSTFRCVWPRATRVPPRYVTGNHIVALQTSLSKYHIREPLC